MIHPTSLRVAVALADTGSATRAARSLCISQPGVSYHLRKLESWLGATLFHRGAAGLVPTAEGEVLVEGAREVLAHLDRLARDVQKMAAGGGRAVRVSSACFTNYHWLPAVLQAFRRKSGEVRVELDVDPSRKPFEALDRGTLDLALTTEPPRSREFTVRELFGDEIVALVHPKHRLAGKPWVEPRDFSDESIAVFDRSQSDLFNLCLVPAGIVPRDVIDMPVTNAILELVRARLAVTAMASWVAQPDLAAGSLRAVRIGREGLQRTWCAVLSSRRPTPPIVATFLEVLRDTCGESHPSGAGLAQA